MTGKKNSKVANGAACGRTLDKTCALHCERLSGPVVEAYGLSNPSSTGVFACPKCGATTTGSLNAGVSSLRQCHQCGTMYLAGGASVEGGACTIAR